MTIFSDFYGPNAGYVIDRYEKYLQDPASVTPDERDFFSRLAPAQIEQLEGAIPAVQVAPAKAETLGLDPLKVAGAINLAQAIRWYGHFDAQLDPLGSPPPGDPALRLETYGLTQDDLRRIPAWLIGGVAGEQIAGQGGTALDVINDLRQIYSSNIGFDYLQNRDPEERRWLRQAAESRRFAPENAPLDPAALLERLTQVETFEHFLQRAFVARTRFSIEGLDMLVPILDEIVGCSANAGIYNILIGMAHRGRLNVLKHVLNKPIQQILAEFKDPLMLEHEPLGFTGDVKYHAGAQKVLDEDGISEPVSLAITMAPNPSHLEAVNPVIEGMARAAGADSSRPGPAQFEPCITLPVLIHGDAAFLGEGVVAETLNLYRLTGYTTGGTVHIIANNQLGFTANPDESRSTTFASDLAKGFRIPIIHVNADDPAACITAARTAFAFREEFNRDFVIDLIGYRRRGHNEGDEPAFTQPQMYRTIEAHPSVRKLWASRLVEQGIVEPNLPEELYRQQMESLQQSLDQLDLHAMQEPVPPQPPPGAARHMNTRVPLDDLERLNQDLMKLPEDFHLHPRLARIRARRQDGGDDENRSIDWATAEELAFASMLEQGIPIRMTGQDVERGTFSQRHAVLHDTETGRQFVPLQSLPEARASFDIYNSPLSEYAALGFEFGYSIQSPERLVIWEAQYGDFVDNAQTIVDEFLVSARDKWGQLPSLVILLPHSYEGQGPDHSSGRLERFLGLSADNNLRVAYPTTAANYFHLLRRQALLLTLDPLPLVVMTPKSLLRHPMVASPLGALANGGWQPVIDRQTFAPEGESAPHLPPAEEVRRMILCSGKVYVDILASELTGEHPEVGVARVEQLAPFPKEDLRELLERYPALQELVWTQEEPENMGAWEFVRPYLLRIAAQLGEERGTTIRLGLAARPRSSSPAEGSNNLHMHNQRLLIEEAFRPDLIQGRNGQPETALERTRQQLVEDRNGK